MCSLFIVDLTEIVDEDGKFPCPNCGVMFDPDDETETVYKLIDTVIKDKDLAELILSCLRCGCKVRLVGFQNMQLAA